MPLNPAAAKVEKGNIYSTLLRKHCPFPKYHCKKVSYREDPDYDLILLLLLDTTLDQDPFKSKVTKIFSF